MAQSWGAASRRVQGQGEGSTTLQALPASVQLVAARRGRLGGGTCSKAGLRRHGVFIWGRRPLAKDHL